jgi:methionine aminopeptidase
MTPLGGSSYSTCLDDKKERSSNSTTTTTTTVAENFKAEAGGPRLMNIRTRLSAPNENTTIATASSRFENQDSQDLSSSSIAAIETFLNDNARATDLLKTMQQSQNSKMSLLHAASSSTTSDDSSRGRGEPTTNSTVSSSSSSSASMKSNNTSPIVSPRLLNMRTRLSAPNESTTTATASSRLENQDAQDLSASSIAALETFLNGNARATDLLKTMQQSQNSKMSLLQRPVATSSSILSTPLVGRSNTTSDDSSSRGRGREPRITTNSTVSPLKSNNTSIIVIPSAGRSSPFLNMRTRLAPPNESTSPTAARRMAVLAKLQSRIEQEAARLQLLAAVGDNANRSREIGENGIVDCEIFHF